MDDETRVLIEQLKRRTANLIYEQSVLQDKQKELMQDIEKVSAFTSLQDECLKDNENLILAISERLLTLEKASEKLSQTSLIHDMKFSSLDIENKISASHGDLDKKISLLSQTINYTRNKLDENIKAKCEEVQNVLLQRINAMEIPEKIDIEAIKTEIFNVFEEHRFHIQFLETRCFQLEGRCLALEKKMENFLLDLKKVMLGRV